jgi:CHAT domain-containing protein
LERRHAAAGISDTELAHKFKQLRDVHRQIERLVQNSALTAEERGKRLAELSEQRNGLERELATALPVLAQWKQRDALSAEDLSKTLPVASVFVDFVAYVRLAQDPQIKGHAGESFADSYAAFVVAPGKPAARVELGPLRPINEAIAAWRKAIETGDDRKTAGEVRRLIWEPLAKQIPSGARTIYLSLDGDLARIPWSALPGSEADSILLEEYSGGIAVVPHGQFLLEHLKLPKEYEGPGSALLLGGVDYGMSKWPPLPGAARELSALEAIRPSSCKILSKADASPKELTKALPKARYAHLAAYGFLDEKVLAAEKQREQDLVRNWQLTESGMQRRVAAKNPLAFTGLVLAKGEMLTGLGLVDLPLENLRVVTLSGCATGLGELTGGEGVQGLQRVFHLSGCPNVVASLWNANDAATAALMVRFYYELWANHKEPLAALREAQMAIYFHPELIPDLAGERGPAKQKEALAMNLGDAKPPAAKRAPMRLCAGFVLSGVGK